MSGFRVKGKNERFTLSSKTSIWWFHVVVMQTATKMCPKMRHFPFFKRAVSRRCSSFFVVLPQTKASWRKIVCQAYIMKDTNNRDQLWKTVRRKNFQNSDHVKIYFNFLQFCPSLPPFAFAFLFKPSFNVLSSYFYVSLDLVARFQSLNLANFPCHTWPSSFQVARKIAQCNSAFSIAYPSNAEQKRSYKKK